MATEQHRDEGDESLPAPTGQRRLALEIAYDGAPYQGWQLQAGRADAPTIQGEVERALGSFLGHPVRVFAAGRTDTGVHALGQVVHFDTASPLPAEGIRRATNALLPEGIAILRAAEVPAGFDARRSAIMRSYTYRLVWGESSHTAVCRSMVGMVPGRHDFAAMQAAAARLVGGYDFAGFRSAHCVAKRTFLDVVRADLELLGPQARVALRLGPGAEACLFTINSRSFLMHMVRRLVGTLLLAGRGKLTPDDITACLEAGTQPEYVLLAPAGGLVLQAVEYPEDPFVPPFDRR